MTYRQYYNPLVYVRYFLVRLLGCPIPGIPSKLPIIGKLTLFEFLVCLFIIAIVLSSIFTVDTLLVGDIAEYLGVVIVLLSLRKANAFTLVLGISFENVLIFHKILGTLIVIAMLVHSTGEGINSSGLGIGIVLSLTAAVYTFYYLNISFNLFYYLHVALYIVLTPLLYIHGATLFALISIIWGFDLAVRYLMTCNCQTGEVKLICNNVVKVEVPKRCNISLLNAKAGQFGFLQVKKINIYEFHPFSIASSPLDEKIVFYIRSSGDWTNQLKNLLLLDAEHRGESASLDVCVEGPYGNLQIELFNSNVYSTAMLMAGGIGVTPMLSIFKHYMYLFYEQHPFVEKLNKIVFVWSVREVDFADGLYIDYFVPVFQQFNIPFDKESSSYVKVDKDGKVSVECTSKIGNKKLEIVFYFHITSMKEDHEKVNLKDSRMFKCKRPNVVAIFESVANRQADNQRVAVASCGPSLLLNEIRECCNMSIPCGKRITYDLHEEVFTF